MGKHSNFFLPYLTFSQVSTGAIRVNESYNLFDLFPEGARVSHKECVIEDAERLDCGYYGISDQECYSRDCCWTESKIPGVPWCYHSISKYAGL